jgi:hypothetical protein
MSAKAMAMEAANNTDNFPIMVFDVHWVVD